VGAGRDRVSSKLSCETIHMWHSNGKNIRGECMKKAAFIKLTVFLVFVLFLFSTSLSIAAETKKPAPPQKTTAPAQAERPKYGGILKVSDLQDGASIGYPPKILRSDANRQGGTAIETLLRYDTSGIRQRTSHRIL
jgi:hypothetical protein